MDKFTELKKRKLELEAKIPRYLSKEMSREEEDQFLEDIRVLNATSALYEKELFPYHDDEELLAEQLETRVSKAWSFLMLLTLIFVMAKLTNFITWSWLLVLAPLWAPLALILLVMLFVLFITMF